MGYQQGLSGLSAASSQLSVIGNNISNSSTVGFKSSDAQFADLYSSTLYGSSSLSTGNGSQLSGVAQNFTAGSITPTGNNLDLAINNNGFFVVRLNADNAAGQTSSTTSNVTAFTRNGQFSVDSSGYLVSGTSRLQGFPALNGVVQSGGQLSDLQVQTAISAPQATSTAALTVNLNSSSTVPTVTPLSPSNTSSYNWSNSTTVYDSLGNQHNMTMYYVLDSQSATGSQWTATAYVDGVAATSPNSTTLNFNTSGQLTTSAADPGTLSVSFTPTPTNGSSAPQTLSVNFAGSTQVAQAFATSSQTVNGYAPGTLSGLNISTDGTIKASYSNGQSTTLGQIALATFTNDQGLQNLGSNTWQQTSASGQASYNTPGSGVAGTIQSGALEESNVDVTTELVNMITAQRFYQANAQTIKTEDSIMQTIMNLS